MPLAMDIDVVYGDPAGAGRMTLTLQSGATIAQALDQVLASPDASQWQIDTAAVGVFGQLKPLDWTLMPGDRLELYAPLVLDPKEARRLRAKNQQGK
jgi:putative ubiquitin-RnfH superfamily antitoxin RatB of RatAB toxin-antitoxin module